jgi:hypothetical protein
MGRACSTHRVEEECIQRFGFGGTYCLPPPGRRVSQASDQPLGSLFDPEEGGSIFFQNVG